MLNNDEKPMGVVYYIHLRQMASQRLKERIKEVDIKIEETRKDIEFLQSIESALEQIELILGRMRETAIAATKDGADRTALSDRLEQYKGEIDRIAATIPNAQNLAEIRELVSNIGISI